MGAGSLSLGSFRPMTWYSWNRDHLGRWLLDAEEPDDEVWTVFFFRRQRNLNFSFDQTYIQTNLVTEVENKIKLEY